MPGHAPHTHPTAAGGTETDRTASLDLPLESGAVQWRLRDTYGKIGVTFEYEGRAFKSETGAISLQPLGGEQATIPHMKAKHVPYQLMYGP